MISETLPWLVNKKGVLGPNRGCNKNTKCYSMCDMLEGISVSETCCNRDSTVYSGASFSKFAFR